MGIGSHDYEGWEVPRYVIWKLENQEHYWCSSTWVPRPENKKSGLLVFIPESEGLRTGIQCSEVQKSKKFQLTKRKRFIAPLPVCFVRAFDGLHDTMHTGEGRSTLLSTNVNFSWRHRPTQKAHFISYLDVGQVDTKFIITHLP